MKRKSEENMTAATLLIEKGLYCSSIHCLYYSCLQLSKYKLNAKFGITYQEQDDQSHGSDSHNWLIKNTKTSIISIKSMAEALDYESYMNKLKRARKKADYTISAITKDEVSDANSNAERVQSILNI